MKLYLILHERSGTQDSSRLTRRLEQAFPGYLPLLASAWIVRSVSTAFAIAVDLEQFLVPEDKLFVTEVTSNAMWSRLSQEAVTAINKHIKDE